MKGWLFVLLVIVALTACEPQQAAQEAVGASPIGSFDKTRLWILLKASRVGDGRRCSNFFRVPNDPRYIGRAKTCEAWTLDFTDYLRLNGLSTLEPAHLRDPVYWQWFENTRQSILDCQQRYVPKGFDATETQDQRLARTEAKYACDPYDNARKNNKQTPDDLGIRFTGRADHMEFDVLTPDQLSEQQS